MTPTPVRCAYEVATSLGRDEFSTLLAPGNGGDVSVRFSMTKDKQSLNVNDGRVLATTVKVQGGIQREDGDLLRKLSCISSPMESIRSSLVGEIRWRFVHGKGAGL